MTQNPIPDNNFQALEGLLNRIDGQFWRASAFWINRACDPQVVAERQMEAKDLLATPATLTGAQAVQLVAIARNALGFARGQALTIEDYRELDEFATDKQLRKMAKQDKEARMLWLVEAVRDAESALRCL